MIIKAAFNIFLVLLSCLTYGTVATQTISGRGGPITSHTLVLSSNHAPIEHRNSSGIRVVNFARCLVHNGVDSSIVLGITQGGSLYVHPGNARSSDNRLRKVLTACYNREIDILPMVVDWANNVLEQADLYTDLHGAVGAIYANIFNGVRCSHESRQSSTMPSTFGSISATAVRHLTLVSGTLSEVENGYYQPIVNTSTRNMSKRSKYLSYYIADVSIFTGCMNKSRYQKNV